MSGQSVWSAPGEQSSGGGMINFALTRGLARWPSVRVPVWLVGAALIVLGCTDPSAPTMSFTEYQGHAEGVVWARGSFATIEGCRLSYSVSLQF